MEKPLGENMTNLPDPKIYFSNAADAIGVTTKVLRNWVQRYDIKLVSDHGQRNWTNFNLADIALLAVIRELNNWGFTIEQASAIAYSEIAERRGLLTLYKKTPPAALVATLKNQPMIVTKNQFGGYEAHLSHEFNYDEKGAHVVINLGVVVENAFVRLGESLSK